MSDLVILTPDEPGEVQRVRRAFIGGISSVANSGAAAAPLRRYRGRVHRTTLPEDVEEALVRAPE